jgi:hypothetical protein
MKITINYRSLLSLFVVKFEEVCDLKSLIKAAEAMLEHREYKDGSNFLLDFREAQVRITADEVQVLWERIKKLFPSHKRKTAIVTLSPVDTALAYLYQSRFNSKSRFEVFSTMMGAEQWLMNELGVECKSL